MEKIKKILRVLSKIIIWSTVVVTLCFFLFMVSLILFNNFTRNVIDKVQTIPNLFPHKTDTFDFSKTKNYSNVSMGISFDHPDSLLVGNTEFNFGIFYSKEDSISFYKKNSSEPVFSIYYKEGKFDPYSVEEFFWGDFTRLSLLKKAYAMPPPTTKKIDNLQVVNISGNSYYTYSYILDRNRHDKYILNGGDYYVTFDFINQKESFCKKIIYSVKNLKYER